MSLEQDIAAIVESQGFLLYDTAISNSETGGKLFEVMLQPKAGGTVTLQDCANISHLLSPLLDVTPPMSGEYRLEVGTPGVERKLKSPSHFMHSIGELVKVTISGSQSYKGKLLEANETSITLQDDQAGIITLPIDTVVKARTYFEW
ncbi:MAG: hypothetical protein KU28_00245 [Sulfurovum sp. PC08-66]|nr:MAG: hypothetical protein KU28_00245 [Sulfurovum sp. PC08-66]KIM12400.1 MAG: hypothetical protein KU37_00365 [Sulfuricurvum sp. PC08-66]